MWGANQLDGISGTVAPTAQGHAPALGVTGATASLAELGLPRSAHAEPEPGPVLPQWRDPSAKWIVVEHRPMVGAKVRLELRRQGWEVHWPREVERRHRCDDVLRPYFPGYMFALACGGVPSWRDLLEDVPCVIGVCGVRETGRPVHPPAGFVLMLIELAGGALDGVIPASEDLVVERVKRRLEPGARVDITAGPWASFSAVVLADRGKRIEVMLSLFGEPRVVAVPRARIAERP